MRVRYYGHLGHPTGYGRAAADTCMALVAAGADLEICPIRTPGVQASLSGSYVPLASLMRSEHELSPPDAVIIHTLPQDCARAAAVLTARHGWAGAGRPRLIAYTTWEATNAPLELIEDLCVFDQVWVPSHINELAFATIGPEQPRTRVLPHSFDEATWDARRGGPAQTEGPFRFYYVGAWSARKNPAALIRAFVHAFRGSDEAELVLQCAGASSLTINSVAASTGLPPERLRGLRPSIATRTDEEILDIHRKGDCYVTASHGEAWNLPAFDAVLAGRHVISPSGLGSDEFLGGTSATLVGARHGIALLDVRLADPSNPGSLQVIGAQGLTSELLWMEPDLLELSDCMKMVAAARMRTIETHYDPRERFGYKAVGALAMNYLQEIPR